MNERVIELYKEAAEFAYKICKDEGRSGGPSDHIWNTLSTGKFAELIIKECKYVILDMINNSQGDFNTLDQSLTGINEHFGIEHETES